MKVEAIGGLWSGGEVEVGVESEVGNPMILLLLNMYAYNSKIGLLWLSKPRLMITNVCGQERNIEGLNNHQIYI